MSKPQTESIPIALMGLGWVGTHRHAVAIGRNRAFKLVGVIDRKAELAAALGERLGVEHAGASRLADVPWIGRARALALATPPFVRSEIIAEALESGVDVLTEKPFAISLSDGENMLDLARRRGRVLAVVHNFQFAQSALALRRDLAQGRLGRIRRVHAVQLSNPGRRLPEWYETLPGGLFYDESPHLLYLMRAFAPGPIRLEQVRIVPSVEGHQTPELVIAGYVCEQEDRPPIPVTLDMHFTAPVSEWHFSVVGERAMGVVDVFRDIYLRLPNDGLHTTSTVIRTSLAATGQHWLQHLSSGLKHLAGTLDYGNNEIYRRFAKAIASREPPEGIDAQDAVEVLRMQHQLLDARPWRA